MREFRVPALVVKRRSNAGGAEAPEAPGTKVAVRLIFVPRGADGCRRIW